MMHQLRKASGLGIAVALLSSAMVMPASADEFTDAIKSAYDTNPRIKAQRKVLETANEQVSQAIANWRPTATATYSNGRQRTRFDNPEFSYGDTENRSLTVTQPIFNGGGNFSRYYSTKESMKAGRSDLKILEQEVLLEAIVAYMDVVQSQSVLDLSANNEEVLEKQLQAARDRFEVGDVTRTDVAQSEARLSRARSDTIAARGDLDSAIAQFERVIGYRPEDILPFPAAFPELPGNLEDATTRALANNPNIESSAFRREASDYDVFTNVSTMLPQVSLRGTMDRQDGAGVFGGSTFDQDQLVLDVTVPLYQSGAEYSRVRESKLIAKRRDFELRDAEDEAREAIIQAWENLQTSIATIEATQEEIRAAAIALDGVQQEQQYGARTILDVLDAEQELFSARVNLVRAQRNRGVSVYNLLLVLGDLTLPKLDVEADIYDPKEHYDSVKWQLIGF